jgi:hypothetical protein
MFDGYCDLYAALCRVGADSPQVLRLADHARPGQAPPLLMLDVVHYLLRENPDHPLKRYYRSLTPEPDPPEQAREAYLSFVTTFQSRLEELLPQRQVQTNEVRRAATTLPLLGVASQRAQERPLALIGLGSSGGLLLLLDHYGYDYGPAGFVGDRNAKLVLPCEARGPVPIPSRIPVIASRVGIDLNPIDVREDAQRRWLEAQIWPTESFSDRLKRLDLAAEVVSDDPPRLVQGDILEQLGPLVEQVPPEQTVCVMHSYTIYEMPQEARTKLHRLLGELGQKRPVLVAGLEWDDHRVTWLDLHHYVPGEPTYNARLGHAQVHGEWVEWL